MERAYSDAASLEEEGQRPDLLEPDYRAVCLTPQFAITIIPATYVLGSTRNYFIPDDLLVLIRKTLPLMPYFVTIIAL